MKLTYDILWFEDQFSALRPSITRLSRFITSKGLIPNIEERTSITVDEIYRLGERLEKHNPYDIIIFDFDMGSGSPDGIEIARALRANIYTDMVFYSGKKPDEIDQIVFENRIQGVFVIHKPDLYNSISPLVEDHIKRISSLNGARGMLMSEWSEIELDLRDFLINKVRGLDDETRLSAEKSILRRLVKQTSERLKKLQNAPDVYDVISDSMRCDFSIIRRSLHSLHKEHSFFGEDSQVQQMQGERNLLAHNKQSLNEDGSLRLTNPKGESRDYDIAEFERLRKSLIDLKHKVDQL
ncbi:MAG: hypothetical protein K6L74_13200 [Neptuniibacter sp.]